MISCTHSLFNPLFISWMISSRSYSASNIEVDGLSMDWPGGLVHKASPIASEAALHLPSYHYKLILIFFNYHFSTSNVPTIHHVGALTTRCLKNEF